MNELVVIASLIILFILEGAIIGKFIPTTAVFPAYILLFEVTIEAIFSLTILAAAAATLGQYSIYILINTHKTESQIVTYCQNLVYENKWYQKFRTYFLHITPTAVLLTNTLPWVRGLFIIPIADAENKYSTMKVLTAAYIGNVVHFGVAGLLLFSGWNLYNIV